MPELCPYNKHGAFCNNLIVTRVFIFRCPLTDSEDDGPKRHRYDTRGEHGLKRKRYIFEDSSGESEDDSDYFEFGESGNNTSRPSKKRGKHSQIVSGMTYQYERK